MQWQAAQRDTASIPPWWPSDFGQRERPPCNKLPDLHEMLDQAKGARAAGQVPVQSVVPMQLPFTSVRDLDCQRQQRHDQTLAKWQPSPLEGEQCKQAKMPPQPDPHDALDGGCTQIEERRGRDSGRSRVRGEDRQQELDRAQSKSQKRSKSRKWSKSQKGARVADIARARRGPRVMGAKRAGCTASMRCESPGSDCLSAENRGQVSPQTAPHNGMGGVPNSRHPQVNGQSSSN